MTRATRSCKATTMVIRSDYMLAADGTYRYAVEDMDDGTLARIIGYALDADPSATITWER